MEQKYGKGGEGERNERDVGCDVCRLIAALRCWISLAASVIALSAAVDWAEREGRALSIASRIFKKPQQRGIIRRV
jgi:hypothetical protein